MCKHHDCRQRLNLSKRLLRVGDRYVICCKRTDTGAKNGVESSKRWARRQRQQQPMRLQHRRREVMPAGAIITAAFVYCAESLQPAQVLLQKIGFRMFFADL
jgi:hypothetical protein